MWSRQPHDILRHGLDARRERERDIRYAIYVQPDRAGQHIVEVIDSSTGAHQRFRVTSAAGDRTFRPGAKVPLGSHTGHPGEFIIGLPPGEHAGRRGGAVRPQVQRHGAPIVTAVAAYVGILNTPGGIVVRLYSAAGVGLQDLGPFAGEVPSGDGVAFVRGDTANSIAGCAMAFVASGALFVLDLEGEEGAGALVEVATTHRPAEHDGFAISYAIKAGAASFVECGILGKENAVTPAEASSYVMYVRTIGVDGTTIANVGSESGHPLAAGALDEIQSRGVCLVGPTTWAAMFMEGDEETGESVYSVAVKTATDAAAFAEIADRYLDNGTIASPGAGAIGGLGLVLANDPVVLWNEGGFRISRVIQDSGGPFAYTGGATPATSRYLREDLLDLSGYTPLNAGTFREDGDLVVLVDEGSDGDFQASRLCTYEGLHPITENAEGPAFERDDAAGESLVCVWGL